MALSLLMIAGGVPRNPKAAIQPVTSYPATPCSIKVGISGNAGTRSFVEMPRARTLPDRTEGMTAGASPKTVSICPPIRSVIAAGSVL